MSKQRLWPIAIIEDRYSGVYGGGGWIAIAHADQEHRGVISRAHWLLRCEGPHGDDCEAMEFWANPPEWIAVGNTPNDALKALLDAAASWTEASVQVENHPICDRFYETKSNGK